MGYVPTNSDSTTHYSRMLGRPPRLAASDEGAVIFLVDTVEHRVICAQRPQHAPRALLTLISDHYTCVVGGARNANGVEM